MSFRLLASSAAALLLITAIGAHAQPAASPPSAAAPAATVNAESSSGKVAYYGRKFAGRKTASGERFDPNALTMAHKSLPFGTLVRVTNTSNKRSVVVRVNDRGPSQADRVGDLTSAAAKQIRMTRAGVIDATLEVVGKRGMQRVPHKPSRKHAV